MIENIERTVHYVINQFIILWVMWLESKHIHLINRNDEYLCGSRGHCLLEATVRVINCEWRQWGWISSSARSCGCKLSKKQACPAAALSTGSHDPAVAAAAVSQFLTKIAVQRRQGSSARSDNRSQQPAYTLRTGRVAIAIAVHY